MIKTFYHLQSQYNMLNAIKLRDNKKIPLKQNELPKAIIVFPYPS